MVSALLLLGSVLRWAGPGVQTQYFCGGSRSSRNTNAGLRVLPTYSGTAGATCLVSPPHSPYFAPFSSTPSCSALERRTLAERSWFGSYTTVLCAHHAPTCCWDGWDWRRSMVRRVGAAGFRRTSPSGRVFLRQVSNGSCWFAWRCFGSVLPVLFGSSSAARTRACARFRCIAAANACACRLLPCAQVRCWYLHLCLKRAEYRRVYVGGVRGRRRLPSTPVPAVVLCAAGSVDGITSLRAATTRLYFCTLGTCKHVCLHPRIHSVRVYLGSRRSARRPVVYTCNAFYLLLDVDGLKRGRSRKGGYDAAYLAHAHTARRRAT